MLKLSEISTGAEGVAAMGVDTFPGLLSGNTKFTSTDTMPVQHTSVCLTIAAHISLPDNCGTHQYKMLNVCILATTSKMSLATRLHMCMFTYTHTHTKFGYETNKIP